MSDAVDLRITARGGREAAREVGGVRREVQGLGPSAQGSRRHAQGLAGDVSRLDRVSRAASDGVGGLARGVGRGLVGAAKAGGVALAAVSLAAGAASVKSVQLSQDAAETASAFGTVFADQADGLQSRLDGISARFGTYGPELQDAAKGFGVFGQAAGIAQRDLGAFSGDLIQAGLDLGSFHNAAPEEAFQAIRSGLSGEAEPLRRFGIFLSDATMKAEAAQLGLTGQLTESQKVMVRQRIILGGLGAAQDDLARTADSAANQQRAAAGRAKELSRMWGEGLQPAATGLYRGLNAFLTPAIEHLSARMPQLQSFSQSVGDRLEVLGVQAGERLPEALQVLSGWWDRLTALPDVFASFRSSPEGAQGLSDMGTALAKIGPGLQDAASSLPAWTDLMSVSSVVIGFAADNVDLLAKALPFLAAGYVALKVAQTANNAVQVVSLPLKIAEWQVNRQLVASNRALVASRTVGTTAAAASTTAETANTAARSGGVLATVRQTAANAAHRVGLIAGAAATGVVTAAQWLWNAALTANPIGIVVVAIGALVAGLVIAYNKSETFRSIVNGLWAAMKTAGEWAFKLFTRFTPLGLVLSNTGTIARTVGNSFKWIWEQAKKAWDWVGKMIDKLKQVPGGGLLSGAIDKLTGGDGRALGGPVVPGHPYTVGEGGRELFVPEQRGRVVAHGKTERLLSAARSSSTTAPQAGVSSGFDPRTRVQFVVGRRVVADATLEDLAERRGR